MSRLLFRMRVEHASNRLNITYGTAQAVLFLPIIIVFVFALFLTIPASRPFTKVLLTENQPVELLTFFFLLIAGILGVYITIKTYLKKEHFFISLFYGMFSVLLFLVAMEEIAWGQWFFGFDTPFGLNEINVQNELTLHNIEGVHGKTEFLRLGFGIGGLVGLLLTSVAFFRFMTPSILLLSWFVVITCITIPDIWNDYTIAHSNVKAMFDSLSELNEMLIGFTCVLYIAFNLKLIRREWEEKIIIGESVA